MMLSHFREIKADLGVKEPFAPLRSMSRYFTSLVIGLPHVVTMPKLPSSFSTKRSVIASFSSVSLVSAMFDRLYLRCQAVVLGGIVATRLPALLIYQDSRWRFRGSRSCFVLKSLGVGQHE